MKIELTNIDPKQFNCRAYHHGEWGASIKKIEEFVLSDKNIMKIIPTIGPENTADYVSWNAARASWAGVIRRAGFNKSLRLICSSADGCLYIIKKEDDTNVPTKKLIPIPELKANPAISTISPNMFNYVPCATCPCGDESRCGLHESDDCSSEKSKIG